jgi:hypothetical protein
LNLFTESPLLLNSKDWFENQFFVYVARSIYGVSPEQIDRITLESVFQAICERFEGITINDIQTAFRMHVQIEKTYNLTRDEFIAPINTFWSKKLIVKNEINLEINQIKLEEESKKKVQESYEEAKQLYFDSIGKGFYLGDMFHASMIFENFKNILSIEEKKELLEKANHKYMDAKNKENEFNIVPNGFGKYKDGKDKPKCHYFLALEVINYFLSKNYKFVEV